MFTWAVVLKLWNSFVNLVKKNWKWVLIFILVIAGYIIINNHINSLKQTAYNNGVATERQNWKDRIAIENAANKKYSDALQSALDQFGQNFKQQQDKRNQQADTHIQEIPIIIKNDPALAQCNVPQAVLDQRNAIRHLGPPGIEQ